MRIWGRDRAKSSRPSSGVLLSCCPPTRPVSPSNNKGVGILPLLTTMLLKVGTVIISILWMRKLRQRESEQLESRSSSVSPVTLTSMHLS